MDWKRYLYGIFHGDQFCLLQEEEKEGIQMTTITKQHTPAQVKQNFFIHRCDFLLFYQTASASLKTRTYILKSPGHLFTLIIALNLSTRREDSWMKGQRWTVHRLVKESAPCSFFLSKGISIKVPPKYWCNYVFCTVRAIFCPWTLNELIQQVQGAEQ